MCIVFPLVTPLLGFPTTSVLANLNDTWSFCKLSFFLSWRLIQSICSMFEILAALSNALMRWTPRRLDLWTICIFHDLSLDNTQSLSLSAVWPWFPPSLRCSSRSHLQLRLPASKTITCLPLCSFRLLKTTNFDRQLFNLANQLIWLI